MRPISAATGVSLGGHYVWQLANKAKTPIDLHVDRQWLIDQTAIYAERHGVFIGIGGCCKAAGTGATEDYLYIGPTGKCYGWHTKICLPAYDDIRAGGHGELWPETNFRRRCTPIEIPELRLRIGSVPCWEVFNQLIWPAYSLAGVNLVVNFIKFAPRGWLKNEVLADGKKHIVGFGNAPNSDLWVERLKMAGKHQVMCPIAVSCNSWNLGPKFMALVGHVDEMREGQDDKSMTDLHDVPAIGTKQYIHVFDMLPEWYEGIDHHHSAGAFKAHVGDVEGFSELGAWTMHTKVRRLEAHCAGGTTAFDCVMKAAALAEGRQKKSTPMRAFGAGIRPVKRKRLKG